MAIRFRGFQAIHQKDIPGGLKNDLIELERWLRLADNRLAELTAGETLNTINNYYSGGEGTVGPHASTHSRAGSDPLAPYPQTWNNDHVFQLLSPDLDGVTITLKRGSNQVTNLLNVTDEDGVHLFEINKDGEVGIQAPTSLDAWFTIRNPGVGQAAIAALNPAGWWAADDPLDNGGSSTPSNGQEMTTDFASWADISGNNRDQASNNTVGSRPQWYNAVGASPAPPSLPNNNPVFSFVNRHVGTSLFSGISLGDFTVYGVVYLALSGPLLGENRGASIFDNSSKFGVQALDGSVGSRIDTGGDGGGDPSGQIDFTGVDFSGTNWRRVMFRRSGTTVTHEIDDTPLSISFQSNQGDGIILEQLMRKTEDLSVTESYNTWVAEIIVFSTALSEANQAKVESYLDNKYGTGSGAGSPGSLPFAQLKDSDNVVVAEFDELGRLHIGGEDPDAAIEATATTEQLRLSYDSDSYVAFTVDSSGDLTIAPTGGDVFVTGELRVTDTANNLRLAYDGSNYVDFTVNSSGDLTIAPTGQDVAITGALQLTRTTEQLRVSYDASNYLYITVASNGSTSFDLNGTSPEVTFNNEVNLDGAAQLPDGHKLWLGDDKDASIQWDGSNMILSPRILGAGSLRVEGNATLVVVGTNGNIELQGASGGHILGFTRTGENFISATGVGGDINFRVNGAATTVGKFTTTGLRFDDSLSVKFGTGGDSFIDFNGTSMRINAPNADPIQIFSDTVGITVDGLNGISMTGGILIDDTFIRFEERTAPSSPPANHVLMYLASTTGELSVKKDDGSVVSLETAATASTATIAGPVVITACASGITADRYLNMDGIQSTATRSYAPTRTGSITGVSASMSIGALTSHGTIDIEVHKNGSMVFSAQVTTSGSGDHVWSATQASGIDTFTGGTDELALYINYGTFSGTITVQASMELVFDDSIDTVIKKIGGTSGSAGSNETWQILTADSSDITTATLSSSLMTTTAMGSGTWKFVYTIIYQTDDANNGIGFGVNHTGTVDSFIANWRHVTTGSSDTTGVADSVAATSTGQMVEGKSGLTHNAIIGSVSTGADAADTNILAVLEGIIVISATGSLELKIASENAGTAVRIKAGTMLELKKVA